MEGEENPTKGLQRVLIFQCLFPASFGVMPTSVLFSFFLPRMVGVPLLAAWGTSWDVADLS